MTMTSVTPQNPLPTPPPAEKRQVKMRVEGFSAFHAGKPALQDIDLEIFARDRLAVIGPASSGKTTFLRSLNRLNDLDHNYSHSGRILLDGQDIYDGAADVPALRRRVGMVYAVPIPLPWSIFDNIAYGPRLAGIRNKAQVTELVESGLKNSFLWDEVKDRLHMPAHNLSGGQQQRMCLARVLALQPEVLILDEPCSGLDPISTAKIEEALAILKDQYSIVLVTNNTKQAARASDRTAFFLMGRLIEIGPTDQLFANPRDQKTSDYITGHFG